MGKKIGEKDVRKVRYEILSKTSSPSDIKVIYKFASGFQGIRGIKELVDLNEITVNQKVYLKLSSKPGHLSLAEIRDVLEDPEGIYRSKDNRNETWFFASSEFKVKRVVVMIECGSKSHRLATAYMISKNDFDKLTKNMDLIWEP